MRCIAIPFELNEAWMGGSYYIRNLISAMKLLPETEQPFILLVCELPDSVRFIKESGYPHVGWVRLHEFVELTKAGFTDVVFPHPIADQEARTISWIPDFQELHLGYFFAEHEIASRRDHHRRRFATAGLIVSSEDVRKDVERFYPGKCQNVAVVRFASFDTHDPTRVEAVRLQYGLTERYVFCANQVWLHKNHILVIRAVALLKERGINVTIVFTGNEADYRVAGYADFLKCQAAEWGIADRVHFLGFIPRGDQLCLMRGARYIVQPSLFEGWSTVIEDAKAMGKFIVASDLAVHQEQLTEACRFFFRHDPLALADVMAELEETETLNERTINYTEARIGFARDFMEAVRGFLPDDSSLSYKKVRSKIETFSNKNLALLAEISSVQVQDKIKLGNHSHDKVCDIQNRFCISIHHRSDTFNLLNIFSAGPVMMNRRYEKFSFNIVQIRSTFHIELPSDGFERVISTSESSSRQGAGYSLRIQLHLSQNAGRMIGVVKVLPEEVLEDLNIALEEGIDCLRRELTKDSSIIPAGLTPIADGVLLYTNQKSQAC